MEVTAICVSQALPSLQNPEVFGMHENVDITRELQDSKLLLDSVLITLGQLSSSGGGSSETQLSDIANDILGKMPPSFDLEKAEKTYPVTYNESMNTVLVQEMERFNKCVADIVS